MSLTNISGADVAARVDELKARDDSINMMRQRVAEKTNNEAAVLQSYIYSNANPNPAVVVLCVAIVVLGLWLIHLAFLKPCVSGKWLDATGNIWHMKHNRFTDKLDVVVVSKSNKTGDNLDGEMLGNMFKCGEFIGVWDLQDSILLIHGGLLQRVHE
jgi:hypothetical protein